MGDQEEIEISVSTDDLKNGLKLDTGKKYKLVLPALRIHLEIDPNDTANENDKYTLYSTDAGKYYKKTMSVKDDKVPGDDTIDLDFPGVRSDLKYTLEVDPGSGGEKYKFFENVPYSVLARGDFQE